MNRRHFLGHMAGGVASTAFFSQFTQTLAATAPTTASLKKKKVIFMYAPGGYTHMDTLTIKAGSANQGAFEPLKTSADGIEISEAAPKMAEQFKYMWKIESYNSGDGDHGGGTMINTTFRQTARQELAIGVRTPWFGATAAHYIGDPKSPLQVISVQGVGNADPGYFGNSIAPVNVGNPGQPPDNIALPQMGNEQQTMARGLRRRDLLTVLEDNFKGSTAPHLRGKALETFGDAAQVHSELVQKALDVTLKTGREMFGFGTADAKSLEKYGNSGFGRGLLLARKLVEKGVSVVKVNTGMGWDDHGNVANAMRQKWTGVVDPAVAALVSELNERGMLQDTMVVWASDFGRTPRINQNAGRDHWPVGWTIWGAGGGMKGGVSYGETDKDGMSIKSNPVRPFDLAATLYTALGIDLTDVNIQPHDNLGRRVYVAGEKNNHKPIKELLA